MDLIYFNCIYSPQALDMMIQLTPGLVSVVFVVT